MADDPEWAAPSLELLEEYYRKLCNWGRWGPEDERGTANLITPEKVREAAALVRRGVGFSLQLPMDASGPQRGGLGRVNPIHQMMATGTDHVAGKQDFPNGLGYADDSLFLVLQGGTQWDALSHIFRDGQMYNGYGADLVDSSGARRNGVENIPTLVTRGVLLDLPRVVGRDHLRPGEAIDADLLDAACAHQRVTVADGDALLIRTGDMARRRTLVGWDGYAGGDAPGLSLLAMPWLHRHGVSAVATDTWGVEVRPNEISGTFQPLHLIMIVSMGLLVGEIWQLDELAEDCAADGVYEFMLVAPPLVIPGAVGAPSNPQAIK
ncbi:cyclase family protein [Kribbella sp. VKM Ac-2566]|uniref:cyclase family protein n=1 Tax=Kribbella sp. VKM Ac-2566 TaxID=2512218 RepID=UPI0010EE049E|nr:cyclase family protein [Kribbella sp. VKM Ac-2566]TDX08271.1 kynurenine formamidase [Kribbella sp. VKM Ac-2566]